MSLDQQLLDHVLESYETTRETNQLLLALTDGMALFFGSKKVGKLRQRKPIWLEYVPDEGIPKANIRIATFDLESLLSDKKPKYLKESSKDPRLGGDGGGSRGASVEPPVIKFYDDMRRELLAYLRGLLMGELAAIVETTRAAVAMNPTGGHRAIVSLDYYSDRPINTNGLHKDTTGTTLFVALHYINPEPMLGPEYIFDKWPIQSRDGSMQYFTPKERSEGENDTRWHAPWTRYVGSTYYWPKKLLKALEAARGRLPNDKTIHHSSLAPFGLVSFVDELIYHATPLSQTRTQEQKESLFRSVNVSALDFSLPRRTLQRTISMSLEQGETLASPTGGAEKRAFVRLWISVVPSTWYKTLSV